MKTILILLVSMFFISCSHQAKESVTDNNIKVDKIIEVDGITVYRFKDVSRTVYFASKGSTEWNTYHSTGKSGYTEKHSVSTIEGE